MKVLVTGAAGFIGFHLCSRLLNDGIDVYGVDSLNEYYDVRIKHARLNQLMEYPQFGFEKLDLVEVDAAKAVFVRDFDAVVHLAA